MLKNIKICYSLTKKRYGRMAELVDAQDSKSCGSNAVRVRVSLCPPKNK